jgi:hypothetical protein
MANLPPAFGTQPFNPVRYPPLPFEPGRFPPPPPPNLPRYAPLVTPAAGAGEAALEAFRTAPEGPSLVRQLLPLGWLLVPFIIPHLLEPFAPGVQDWLKRGWRGHPGYGIPDDHLPGQILPGSRAVLYRVTNDNETYNAACMPNARYPGDRGVHVGPISLVTGGQTISDSHACRGGEDVAETLSLVDGLGNVLTSIFQWNHAPRGDIHYTVTPQDGVIEGVPSPSAPPVIVPYPPLANPQPGPTPFIPSPSPQPSDPPRLPSTAPNNPAKPSPIPLPHLPPLLSPDPAVAPSPRPTASGAPQPTTMPAPQPSSYPPPAPPRPTVGELTCDNPCLSSIFDGVKDIKKKLEPQSQITIPTYLLSVPVVSCSESVGDLKIYTLVVQGNEIQGLADELVSMSLLALAGCRSSTSKKPEVRLLSGQSTQAQQLFHAPIPENCRFIRLVINQPFPDQTRLRGTDYPAAGQRIFGSVAIASSTTGGGTSQQIYDSDSLISVQRSVSPRFAKILLRIGCSFTLYDTGERISN